MKTQRIRNEAIANTDILAREPAYQGHVLDSLHAGIARALMNIIGDGNEYTVQSIDREEQVDDILSTIFSTTITVGELVRCKDCKHRPKRLREGEGEGFNLEFPDYECPCQCDDGWYNWMPEDNWFCRNGERRES